MGIGKIFFYLVAAAAVGSALLMVTRRNPVKSVLFLIVNFFTLAVLYLFLQAQFVAIIQVLVYAGAIMVLFLFVIMLVNLDQQAKERQFNKQWLIGLAAAALAGVQIGWFLIKGKAAFAIATPAMPGASAGEATRKRSRACCSASICCRSKSRASCFW